MPQCTFSRNPRLAWRKLDGRYVIMTIDDAALHRLNHAGTFMFDLLAGGSLSLKQMAGRMSRKYGIGQADALRDTRGFVDEMCGKGILLGTGLPVIGDRLSVIGRERGSEGQRDGEKPKRASISRSIENATRRTHVLFSALLEITDKCNADCGQCYRQGVVDGKGLSRREIEGVMGNLAGMGCFYLVMTGGEIFMRHDFFSLARQARKLGFALSLFTNGISLTEQAAQKIHDLSPLDVGVSIHGPTAELHDAFTGVKGSFDRAVAGIRHLTALNVRTNIKCLITRNNIRHYKAMFALADSLGVPCEFDAVITPTMTGDTSPLRARPTLAQLRRFLSDKRVMPADFSGPPSHTDASVLCSAGVTFCTILHNGSVVPCLQINRIAGNILEQSLRTIWNTSEVFRTLRSITDSDLAECARCDVRTLCDRCPGLALSEDDNLLGPSSIACKMARLRREIRRTREHLPKPAT